VADTQVPDDVYERVSKSFTPQELVYLTLAVSAINAWNRFNIAFRSSPERAEDIFQWLQSQKREGAA
jgi:alkylhydroperoxidase family enzyme